jgi:putative spermidine/putrescine transport system substrate-binding protein
MKAYPQNLRRSFLKSAVALAAGVSTSALLAGAAMAEGTINFASWGGSYQKAQSEAVLKPGAKVMGITVNEETYGGMSDVRL